MSSWVVLVGLGNPGPTYAGHRHNIGFQFLELVGKRYDFSSLKKFNQAFISEGTIGHQRCLMVFPQTYMNLSGQGVLPIKTFYKLSNEQFFVIHDDLDLAPGKLRMKQGGGHGGHNGLKSLDQCLGHDYWRLRIGIGHPGDKSLVSSYVLSNFSTADHQMIDPLMEAMVEKLPLLVEGRMNDYQSQVVATFV